MDCPAHDICLPNQATFRMELNTPNNGFLHWMSQGHARMAISAKQEAKCQGRMVSLSRQRNGYQGQGLCWVTVYLGTIVDVTNPIHQEYRTGAPIKMILKCKRHGEAGLAMHAAQTSRKHIQAWSKWERAGLINLMTCSKVSGNCFTSKMLEHKGHSCS